jgi:hypothetical protein
MTAMVAARPVYLHIGLQKTGTSYLQSIFWLSQDELRRQGLDMVPGSKRDTFHLMLRVRGRYNPELDTPSVADALARLPEQLEQAPGSRALISEESLAPATPDQIGALMEACAGREVHLVLTLRDLARQIPSAWQQMIQSGSSLDYRGYLRRLRREEGRPRSLMWSSKDIPAILSRWERVVPADRIHLVTVPQSGGDPGLLLRRYCEVLGVDPTRLHNDTGIRNASLGLPQAEVLRRVNGRLSRSQRRRQLYGDVGKRYFAVRVLVPQKGPRIRVPRAQQEWCTAVSARYVEWLAGRGYHVVGDLSELMPAPSSFAPRATRPRERDVADAATKALAVMLSERMRKLRRRRRRQERAPRSPVRRLLRRLRRRSHGRAR